MSVGNRAILELLLPVVASLGCELWGVELHSGTKRKLLRVYIDREPDGVGIEDCERVSRQAASVLDVEDLIRGEYTLEVSSPGMDRPLYNLAHYKRYIGEEIAVKLRFPYENRKNFKGRLQTIDGDEIIMLVADNEYLFPVEGIEKANLVPTF